MSYLKEISPLLKNIRPSVQDVLDGLAGKISAEIQQGLKKHYKEVVNVSSGDSHMNGIKPLTFARQVLAASFYPPLLNDESLPVDVRARAQRILKECDGGSVGSYTSASGIPNIRRSVAEFITRRDGVTSDPDNIIVTDGSQKALLMLLKILIGGEGNLPTGILTPVPSYRSFNMALAAQGGTVVPYHLSEVPGRELQINELHRAVSAARGHCKPKVLYVINPGNPTGHVQSRISIKEVIQFAAKERLFLMADEVYQSNIYGGGEEFHSYKKVLSEMGAPYSSTVELASFHSASKGVLGECGLRGGYLEMVNVDPTVMQYTYTMFTTNSCPSVPGQIALDVMVDPPRPSQPSYVLYSQEVQSIQSTIKKNIETTVEVLNTLPGMSCPPVNGGIFAFPRLHLSKAAIKHAKEKELEPDLLYCLRLLEDEGLCVVAGTDFGQKEGTHHIRISLAAQEEIMKDTLQRLKRFHLRFMKEFP